MWVYSPFGVKIVKLSANIVLRGVNTVYTIASLFLVLLFVFLSDPGDLELVMMHRGYLEAEIDKLMQNPDRLGFYESNLCCMWGYGL